MLLQALHVETNEKSKSSSNVSIVLKGVEMPFPPHYTPAGRSDVNQ